MAIRDWQTLKVRYCEHVNTEVGLEAEVVYPADILPDQSPRLLTHRCSQGYECALENKGNCVWAGNNPDYDPFEEEE